MNTLLRSLTLFGLLALPAVAQDPERIEFHVTSVSGRSVYFDQGSAADSESATRSSCSRRASRRIA